MGIDCCHKCVPPKRTPTCKFDGTCSRYAEAKKKHDDEKRVIDKKKAIEWGLYAQRGEKAYKAMKDRYKKG